MKALVKTRNGVGFSCLDIEVPVPGPGEALIKVIAVDLDDYRLGLAEKYGATALNPAKVDVTAEVRKMTSQRRGADVVLEITGSPGVYPAMFEILRNEGRVSVVGHAGEVPINISQWISLKGASIKGVYGRRIWGTWANLASLVENGKVDLTGVLVHRFELSQPDEAFKAIQSGAGKALFMPHS